MERSHSRVQRQPRSEPVVHRPVHVLIVDDSITSRAMLARIVERAGDLEVVGRANSAEAALEWLQSRSADVILLDLEMPGQGGLGALPSLIAAGRGARVMVVSSLTVDGAEQTLAALSLGATDTLAKPLAGQFDASYAEVLADKVRAMGIRTPAQPAGQSAKRPKPPRLVRRKSDANADLLAIGASTGGIHAFGLLLKALPSRMGIPILVTQHLPETFMPVFARQLTLASGYEALVAEDDMPVLPDRILIAPGDAHLTVHKASGKLVVRLCNEPVASGCMPSVDPMFASLADELGSRALGVVLSGMGRDGAEGAARIVEAGGTIFAQDEASCAVWGMPRAVVEAGLASAILPPDQIASRVIAALGAELRK